MRVVGDSTVVEGVELSAVRHGGSGWYMCLLYWGWNSIEARLWHQRARTETASSSKPVGDG